MENGQPSELAIDISQTTATPEQGNGCSEDSNTHGGSIVELGLVNGSTRQDSVDDSSIRNLLPSSHESSVTVDFELLWRLRKYLVLLGILAVSVTYNAGLSPPGGFWTNNTNGHDGHYAGDPVLRAKFFPRHEVFFYCNATAFAASLVLIILLLSKHVTRQKLWLRSMQFTMILDLFNLMAAYAAGSCRAVKSSSYIWVLVLAVFVYIVIHILVSTRVVPKGLKKEVHSVLCGFLSKWGVRDVCEDQRRSRPETDLEEARKFILMLVTFVATVTYQAGLSPPGGFWAENNQKRSPATSMLRSNYLARYNFFVSCNSTSFVASLVTIILLLSPELSRHGIRSKAVNVCVVVDLLGLIGAYAAGSCRSVAASFWVIFIPIVVWICFAVLAGFFVHKPVAEWLQKIRPGTMMCMDRFGRVFSLDFGSNRSRYTEEENSIASCRQSAGRITDATEPEIAFVPNVKEGESHGEHQSASEQETANIEVVVSSSEHALVNEEKSESTNQEGQSTDHQSVVKQVTSKTENLQVANMKERFSSLDDLKTPNTTAGMSNPEHQSADDQKVLNMMGQSSSSGDHKLVEGLFEDIVLASNHNGATNDLKEVAPQKNDLKEEKKSSDIHLESIEIEVVRMNGDTRNFENGSIDKYEGIPRQDGSNENAGGNPTDEHLKKSRTYLLLLAILAVSLTYQSGLNPPGGFWSKRENNNLTGDPIPKDTHHRLYHLPGDPILEDTHHRRYIAFFYLNAIAFVASLVMIIMLLNRRMSNKVIKRYALQTAMIVDLLALTGSYVMGSCRETKNSIYIWLLLCLVFVYVVVHVLIAIHVIPEGCKLLVAEKLDHWFGHNQRGDANEKDWERRRNLLLMLAVLAATVTYQAGMNPPGGVWSDDKEVSGRPGDPILQHNNFKRYEVFYYSNSVSFVSSVVITILLVNKESCEHGIKSYALRVCLVVGLVGLLIAYSAGSCRKAKESIYLIIIAVAVLISLVIQILLLSSTHDTLEGPVGKFIGCLLERFLGAEEAKQETTSEQQESLGHDEKKVRRRHKYLMLLAILAASITYQAGLNPPGGFWSDNNGHVAGNPVLLDINPRRYETFFCFNSISFMASIVVIMFLLNKSVRKKDVPLAVLHLIMILDLLALMTAFAAGSCRKFRTSVYVYGLVIGVVIYLVIVLLLSSGIAKYLRPGEKRGISSRRRPNCASRTNTVRPEQA